MIQSNAPAQAEMFPDIVHQEKVTHAIKAAEDRMWSLYHQAFRRDALSGAQRAYLSYCLIAGLATFHTELTK